MSITSSAHCPHIRTFVDANSSKQTIEEECVFQEPAIFRDFVHCALVVGEIKVSAKDYAEILEIVHVEGKETHRESFSFKAYKVSTVSFTVPSVVVPAPRASR